MSDLTILRDHARLMASVTDWERPSKSGLCQSFGRALPAEHERCEWGVGCGCRCHDADRDPLPTENEKRLWTQIADEIDAYLAPSEDEPGLFGGVA